MMSFEPDIYQIQDLTRKYMFYSSLINLVLGTISNIMIIFILTSTSKFRKNQCAFYLIVESIADIGLIFSYLPFNIADEILGQSPAQLSLICCKIQLTSCYVFGLYSFVTICFLSFDQYLSTNNQQQWRRLSTIKLAYRLALFNVCFAILHNIIFILFAEIGHLGCSIYNPIVKIYFKAFYYPILSGILPLIFICILSFLAYRNVRWCMRRRITIVRRRSDRQMTAIAFARVLSIFILGLPFLSTTLYELNLNNNEQTEKKLAIYQLASAIAHSFLFANYASNFYIFLYISPRFRHQTKNFFVKNLLQHLTRNHRIEPNMNRRVMSIVESMSQRLD